MKCPACGGTMSKVPTTRHDDSMDSVRRRRVCKRCGGRWWTREISEEQYHQVTAVIRCVERLVTQRTAGAPKRTACGPDRFKR